MPIRFRCAYCNQLMGIASRKAGTVVRCPKCAGEIIVPVPDGAAPATESPTATESAFTFNETTAPPPAPLDSGFSVPTPIEAPIELPPLPRPPGFVLSTGALITSIVVIFLLLVLVFVIGLIIGRHSV